MTRFFRTQFASTTARLYKKTMIFSYMFNALLVGEKSVTGFSFSLLYESVNQIIQHGWMKSST